MHCDYCGQDNHESAYRCSRCRTRLGGVQGYSGGREAVLTAAVAPELAPVAAPAPARKLMAHVGGGAALPAEARPVRQPELFPGDPRAVSNLETYTPIRSRTRAPEAFAELKRRPNGARRVSELQAKFDFSSPRPNSALKCATEFEGSRAPWPVLLAGTLTDAAAVAAFTLACAAVARQFMISFTGVIPGNQYLPAVGAAALIVAIVYKALWAAFGQVTPGLQGVNLELTGFNGSTPNFTQRMLRVVVGWLGFATVGLGVAYSIADRHGLCWHDYASQSYHRLRRHDRD